MILGASLNDHWTIPFATAYQFVQGTLNDVRSYCLLSSGLQQQQKANQNYLVLCSPHNKLFDVEVIPAINSPDAACSLHQCGNLCLNL